MTIRRLTPAGKDKADMQIIKRTTSRAQALKEPALDIRVALDAEEIDPVPFLERIKRDPRHATQAKWAIVTLYETGKISSRDAIYWLAICGFIRATQPPYPNQWMETYIKEEKEAVSGSPAASERTFRREKAFAS